MAQGLLRQDPRPPHTTAVESEGEREAEGEGEGGREGGREEDDGE